MHIKRDAITEPRKPVLFLSYCSKDSQAKQDLITFARSLGVTLKFDDEILLASNPISDRLRDEIERCDACVWILTENSVWSKWCPPEVGAFWGTKKPIIIYNPTALDYDGPFHALKQPRSRDDIKRALDRLEVRSMRLSSVTLDEAMQLVGQGLDLLARSMAEELS